MKDIKYMPISQMKDRHVYRILARNARVGIWMKEHRGFLISRSKFGKNFLFIEHHWDHNSFPTAKPIEEIEMLPKYIPCRGNMFDGFINGSRVLTYLNKLERSESLNRFLSEVETIMERHMDGNLCSNHALRNIAMSLSIINTGRMLSGGYEKIGQHVENCKICSLNRRRIE